MCTNCHKKKEQKTEESPTLLSTNMPYRIGTIVNRGAKNRETKANCLGHKTKRTGNH